MLKRLKTQLRWPLSRDERTLRYRKARLRSDEGSRSLSELINGRLLEIRRRLSSGQMPQLVLRFLSHCRPQPRRGQQQCSGLGITLACVALLFSSHEVIAQEPASVTKVVVEDYPNDDGTGLSVSWDLSTDDTEDASPRIVTSYRVERVRAEDSKEGGGADWESIGEATFGESTFDDRKCEKGGTYRYRVVAIGPGGESGAVESEGVQPVVQWWDRRKTWFAVLLAVVSGAIVFFIQQIRSGKTLKIRRIAGLDAVTEAVGRATEMGRPCLFVPGIQDINDIQTVAGVTILSRVARIAADYDAPIEVPTARSLVMTTARETMQAAYFAAGRPDAYNENKVYYVTDEQFGYVASVTGTMVREKPAACFYMGAFYAESLILAETGNSVGAIQVAGTAMPTQLPFFVAACDYTLIGEEFFAASAYLSGEPQQLGSLKGQDTGKVVGGSLLLAGCVFATLQQIANARFPDSSWADAFNAPLIFLRDHILGDQGFLP